MDQLKTFMLRLASDGELLNRFVAAPDATAREEGLDDAERAILFSGNQNRIYCALVGKPYPPPPPPPPTAQAMPQPPRAAPPQFGWSWTPWGWRWMAR